jgi:hypothetical protein
MIDEPRLRELLEAAAAEAPVPNADAIASIEAMADASPQPRPVRAPSRRRWTRAVPALAALLALVVGAGVLLNSGGDTKRALTTTGAQISGDALGSPAETRAPSGGLPALTDTAKIVKTGAVDLEVRKGRFGVTVEHLNAVATSVNGYIAKRETSETASAPHGTVTLRVPVDAFEGAVSAIRRMGQVRSVSSEARDATAEYTDRETRLKALTAERDQLLAILSGARTIPDILAVRDRSTQVQVEIERLQGQQRLLDEQAAFATLAVTVAEPGGGLEPLDERSGVSGAWHDAVGGFVGGAEAILAASGTIVLVLLCAIAVALAGRAGMRLARRRLV